VIFFITISHCAVAKRAKKDSQNKTREDLESSNPALTLTTNSESTNPALTPTPKPAPSNPECEREPLRNSV
jgi:hypothetical protein